MESEVPETIEELQPPAAIHRKSIWEWLPLPVLLIVLIATIIWSAIYQTQNSLTISRQQHDTAVSIAADQQREAILTNYMDKISDMLVHDKLLQASNSDVSKIAADAYTLAALRGLDPDRKASLMRFLYQTKLIGNDSHIISMREADVHNAHLANADLRDTYLVGINLSGADLHGAILSDTILTFANLSGANLAKADFHASDMHNANLAGADLAGANLRDAVGLNEGQLAQAKSLAGATMPDGSVHR